MRISPNALSTAMGNALCDKKSDCKTELLIVGFVVNVGVGVGVGL